MELRRADARDIPALVGLNAHVHDLHVAHAPERYRPTEADAVAAFFSGLLDDGAEIWLALAEGAPVAYLVALVRDRPTSPFSHASRVLHVDQIAVHAAHRSRGVGRRLMAHAEELALRHGCTRVELDVAGFNHGALAFYEALGFAPVQHRLRRELPLLRPYEAADRPGFVALFTNPAATARTGGVLPSRQAASLFDAILFGRSARVRAAWAVGRPLVGHAALLDHPEGAELAFVLHPSVWGRGLGTAVARALVQQARLVGARPVATVDMAHAASRRILEKVGLRLLREEHDAEGTYLLYATDSGSSAP